MGKDLTALPDVLREPVARWMQQFGASDHQEEVCRVVACSEFAAATLMRERDWFLDHVRHFGSPPDTRVPDDFFEGDHSLASIQSMLRRTRNRCLLHVLWREVLGLADLDETLGSLSDLAGHMLDSATRAAERAIAPRYGVVRSPDGNKVPLVVVGMGKLGGRELNFSSDIDLIFLYPEDGETDGNRRVSAQEYFGRLVRRIVALLDERTADGFVFRIDTRLRPFGDSGPPVVSFAALESYLVQHGRDWERYAYIKARVVGPHPGDAVVEDLHANLIRPFVYRRYIDYGVFQSLREMHALIAAEVQKRELQDNIKLGPGGIREAEFVVQSLQLVRGGSEPRLQARQLQKVLPLLVNARGLTAKDADQLGGAYRFLRRLENFIQAIADQQTHNLPGDEVGRSRLCLAMQFPDWDALSAAIDRHRATIASQFERVAFRGQSDDKPLVSRAGQAWESAAGRDEWVALFRDEGIDDAAELAEVVVTFANEAITRQIDTVSRERLQHFIPRLVREVTACTRPGLVLARVLGIVERILRRSAYLSLLNENQAVLKRLVDLCDRSNYIAEQIARFPVLLDELLDPRLDIDGITRTNIEKEMAARLGSDGGDSESRMQSIAQFQRAMMFRIAIADFSDTLPIMKVSDGLTWLAEAVLEEALRVAWRDLTARHGVPRYHLDGVTHEAGFGIIAYGKLGGLELSYGSDLDVIFLHDSCGSRQTTDGPKPLDNGLFFARLVRRLMHLLTMQTGSGQLYEVDTRLRPDGHKGLLVTNTEAFERYQEANAWTWEHQALLRARPVAGSRVIADQFERIRRETLVGRVRRKQLREDVIEMRAKMRAELDRSDAHRFDLKHGRGGIGDIEFLVQYLVLDNAQAHPDVIHYSDNIRQLDALAATGCIEAAMRDALQDAYRAYRLRFHHLVLDGEQPLVGPDDFVEQRELVAQTWDAWLG